MKRLLLLFALSTVLLLQACSETGNDFYALRQLEDIEVLDIGREQVGKTSYSTIIFKDNGKEKELRFKDVTYGFTEYYDSAQLFDEKVIVDVVIDPDNHIISIVLKNRGGSEDGKK